MLMIHAFLVEDDAASRAILEEALREMADTDVVGWAGTENGAVDWLARHPRQADVVVLDLFLDAGSGLGALARLSKLPQRPRVVVLSGGATSLLRRSCLLLGAEAVFDKATDLEALCAHCRAIGAHSPPAQH